MLLLLLPTPTVSTELAVEPVAAAAAISWEDVVVSAEIFAAFASAVWLARRRSGRHECLPLVDASEQEQRPPFLQPRACWSLRALLMYRVCMVVFYAVVQLYDVYRSRGRCLAFYTSWNFIAQGSYFSYAALRTWRTLQTEHLERSQAYAALLDSEDYDGTGNSYHKRRVAGGGTGWISMDLVLDVCLSTSILICAVVWTVLYPYAVKIGHPESILNWVSYCQHMANVLLLQLDFFATKHRVSRAALPLVMGWPSLYAVFAWIVHGTVAKGFWPYPFLSLKTPWAPVWYGGILFAHMLFFALVLGLSRFKHNSRFQTRTATADATDGSTTV